MFLTDVIGGSRASNLRDLILEGAADRYRQMFQGILAANQKLKPQIDAEIKWALQSLKKDDRIIWYLRNVQVYLMLGNMTQTPEGQQAVEKKINQLARKGNVTPEKIKAGAEQVANPNFKGNIEHYLSLPIQDITGMQFAWQSPQEIFGAFQEAENEWKENQQRTIDFDEDHEVVLDFKDGYKWMNLNRAYCDKEAQAMGHCGNSPRSHTDDTILSLRKDVQYGDEVKQSPVLTFILKSDGYLTEMKGRGNDKPAARYHKYIIPLLKLDIIEGIKGGGYMPQNNFSINDLDDDVKEDLLAEKPELAGPMERVRKFLEEGKTKEAVYEIKEMMDENRMDYDEFTFYEGEPTKDNYWHVGVRLASYDDYEEFIGVTEDKATKSLYDLLDDVERLDSHDQWFNDHPNWYQDWLKNNGYSKLANKKQMQLFKDNPDLPKEKEVKEKIREELGTDKEPLIEKIKDRLKEYAELGYAPDGVWNLYFTAQDEKDILGKWHAIINLGDILDIIEGNDEEDSEYYYQAYQWAENVDFGYYVKPDEYMSEKRDEEGLQDFHEEDELAEEIRYELENEEEDDDE